MNDIKSMKLYEVLASVKTANSNKQTKEADLSDYTQPVLDQLGTAKDYISNQFNTATKGLDPGVSEALKNVGIGGVAGAGLGGLAGLLHASGQDEDRRNYPKSILNRMLLGGALGSAAGGAYTAAPYALDQLGYGDKVPVTAIGSINQAIRDAVSAGSDAVASGAKSTYDTGKKLLGFEGSDVALDTAKGVGSGALATASVPASYASIRAIRNLARTNPEVFSSVNLHKPGSEAFMKAKSLLEGRGYSSGQAESALKLYADPEANLAKYIKHNPKGALKGINPFSRSTAVNVNPEKVLKTLQRSGKNALLDTKSPEYKHLFNKFTIGPNPKTPKDAHREIQRMARYPGLTNLSGKDLGAISKDFSAVERGALNAARAGGRYPKLRSLGRAGRTGLLSVLPYYLIDDYFGTKGQPATSQRPE